MCTAPGLECLACPGMGGPLMTPPVDGVRWGSGVLVAVHVAATCDPDAEECMRLGECRYVGGLVPDVEDKELRDKFYSFGEISSIKARTLSLQSPFGAGLPAVARPCNLFFDPDVAL